MLSDTVTLEELARVLAEVRSDRLLSVSQVAARFEVEPDEVRLWARQGILPAERVGGRLVFRLADVVEWEVHGRLRLQEGSNRTVETLPQGGRSGHSD